MPNLYGTKLNPQQGLLIKKKLEADSRFIPLHTTGKQNKDEELKVPHFAFINDNKSYWLYDARYEYIWNEHYRGSVHEVSPEFFLNKVNELCKHPSS